MTRLDQLPTELICLISRQIPLEILPPFQGPRNNGSSTKQRAIPTILCDNLSVAPLSMTCRFIRSAVRPILFERVSLSVWVEVEIDSIFQYPVIDMLHDLEEEPLRLYANAATLVRHLSFTGRNDGPIEEYISFVCQILSCFPKLHRVKLDISAQISFSPRVLQLVRDRIELAEVSIPKLTLNPHNGEQDWLVMQPLASVLREKVRVLTAEYWVWSEHWQNEFSSWRLVEDWGLSVHKLIVRTDQRAQINLSQWWSQITWRGLQEIITDQPFLHGSDETPGSFREFLTRHPTLLSIDTLLRLGSDDQRWHSESFNLAPVLRACSQSGFHPQFAKFGRSTGVTPFEFQCKNLVIIPPTDLTAQRSLELLSKSCPNMQFLALNFHRCPVNMIQIRDYACSSLRRLFQDVVFHNSLIEVCISWYTADVDVDESDDLPPWQSSVTAFGVAMSEISLEIAKASPSITLIHHFIFSKGLFVPTASWPFAVNKSQDGAIHLRQESRHEGLTREWMRLV